MTDEKHWVKPGSDETIEMPSAASLEHSGTSSIIQPAFMESDRLGPWARFTNYFFPRVRFIDRRVTSRGAVFPPNYITNAVDNARFNWLTFFPLVFFHQFKHFLNLYFLAIALMQLIPVLRVGEFTRPGHHLRVPHRDHNGGQLHQGSH
jgi:hypothetical protein